MSTIDPNATLAALVLDEPARADVFEALGLDYCCNGERSLAEACAERGLDAATAAAVIGAHRARVPDEDERDWRGATTAELCDHIVEAHHDRLRRELPVLAETAAKVAAVHGPEHPELRELAGVFDGLRRELEEHIEREEQVLFPACRALAAGDAVDQALVDELGHDHEDVGRTLLALRELGGGYREESARCGTHRALLRGLHELERDLHRHIHEENNVLFPRVLEGART